MEETKVQWEYLIVIGNIRGRLVSVNFNEASGDLFNEISRLGRIQWELVDTVRFEENKTQRIQYNFKRKV